MNEPLSSHSNESEVDQVIARYFASLDRGEKVSPEELISKNPNVGDELRAFFANRKVLIPWTSPRVSGYDASALPNSMIGKSIGDYVLHELIGAGGMGLIYRATQKPLGRDVAMKLIRGGSIASEAEVARFRREAEFAGMLDHPAVVPILDFGCFEGNYYMVMSYVAGPNLSSILNHGPISPLESAEACIEICDGLAAAHKLGIIHRDLKPSNILLQPKDRKASMQQSDQPESASMDWRFSLRDFRVRVTDFGLAKLMSDEAAITRSGDVLGTPSFMAPEQARGDLRTIDVGTDIYALGAILYNMLTGRPPFYADSVAATLQQVITSDVVPPRVLNRAVPKDLDALCMKCLSKDPTKRYASADELTQDLARFVRGEPVLAKRTEWWGRLEYLVQQERRDEYFQGWGPALIAIGIIVLLSHVLIEVLQILRFVGWQAYFLPRVAMFGGLAFCLFYFRRYSIWPINSVERLIWMIWLSYLMALGAVNASRLVMNRPQVELYPVFSAIAGAAFLLMGSQIWRGCYAIGIAFFVLAPVTGQWLHYAPLAFGLMWGIALIALGISFNRDLAR